MSNVLYNEVKGYKFGDWKNYARHNENEIAGFFGDYRWLSNFHVSNLYFAGMEYSSVECAYQAAKFGADERAYFQTCKPVEAKKYGRNHEMTCSVQEWDSMKDSIMQECVFSKFLSNKELKNKLIATKNQHLEETNNWKDIYWGVCNGRGQNKLGQILVATREYFLTMEAFNE